MKYLLTLNQNLDCSLFEKCAIKRQYNAMIRPVHDMFRTDDVFIILFAHW